MKHTITLIPGDGIGPEITEAMKTVIAATGVDIEWELALAGQPALDAGFKDVLPEATLASIRKNKVAIKGPIGTPTGSSTEEGFKSVNVAMRKALNLYANVRPSKSYQSVPSNHSNVDLVIFRENTEDVYLAEERVVQENPRIIETFYRTTETACEKIVRAAFEYAVRCGRKKVTAFHKGNIIQLSHGLFEEVFFGVAAEFPRIEKEVKLMDSGCCQLEINPSQFDVIVTLNLFGDILSDLTAGIANKTLGLAAGANIGDEYALFEAVHGTAPDLAGKGVANPTALILSAAMMLDHLGEDLAANYIRLSVEKVLKDWIYVTGDLRKGSQCSTTEMAVAIADGVLIRQYREQ